jgi:hypothetical protein
MQKEEQEINKMNQEVKSGQSAGLDPRVMQYVRDARKAGLHDEIIWDELKKVGWSDEDIKRALK